MVTLQAIARKSRLALVCMSLCACVREAPVAITHADFGVYSTLKSGEMAFVPARRVPYAIGQQYGWLMQVRTDEPVLTWHEEITLPAAPRTWGNEKVGRRQVAPDGRSLVTERHVSTRSGYLYNAWQIEPGDPRGHYTIKVTIEDGPSRTFAFDVK